jgi:hypothetical protein
MAPTLAWENSNTWYRHSRGKIRTHGTDTRVGKFEHMVPTFAWENSNTWYRHSRGKIQEHSTDTGVGTFKYIVPTLAWERLSTWYRRRRGKLQAHITVAVQWRSWRAAVFFHWIKKPRIKLLTDYLHTDLSVIIFDQ